MKSKFKIGDVVDVIIPTGCKSGTAKTGIVKYIARQDETFIYSIDIKETPDSKGVEIACNESCLSLTNEV